MKHLDFRRFALSSCVAVTMLAGCGGSQPPIGTPGAMPQTATIAAHVRHPVAHPTSLFFYSRHPLKFTVRQTDYYGRFTMSDSACYMIASVSPKSAKGPRATFKVTPIESPSGGGCVVTVADAHGHKAKVSVGNPGY
jgi:hypothetical protein